MGTLSAAVSHLGLEFGGLCAIAGFALRGAEGALLVGLLGYFVGKTAQSLLWTFHGDDRA